MNKEALLKADEYLAAHTDEMLDIITTLAKYPSIAGEAQDGAPFGKACLECLEKAAEIAKDYGFCAKVAKSKKYAVATRPGNGKVIGIFAHTDVVPISEEDWIFTKPFEPKHMGDVLVGRGVEDNKAGVALAIHAIKLLEFAGLAPKSTVCIYLGSNEESGMLDIEDFVAENKMPDVSLVPDGGFPVSFGEKGICRAHMILDGKFEEIVEFFGGDAYNIMLDKLFVKIKYGKELYAQISEKAAGNKYLEAQKSGDYIILRSFGIPKHAASPEGGVNAACVAAAALCECEALCENDRKLLKSIEELTGDFYGEKLGIACSDECFGKLTSVNGICSLCNGVPNIALDIRYGTKISASELESKLLAAYPNAYIRENKAGFAISKDDGIAKALEKVYAEFSGNADAHGFYMGGGTYARYLKNAFSVGTQAGYIRNDVPELPDGHGGAHQSDEILRIKQFVEAVKVVAFMIHECDKAVCEQTDE